MKRSRRLARMRNGELKKSKKRSHELRFQGHQVRLGSGLNWGCWVERRARLRLGRCEMTLVAVVTLNCGVLK